MKKYIILLNLFLILNILYGCWGRVDINKLMTASAIGIDKSEKGYKVTVQAINASSLVQEGANRSSIVVQSEEGKTVFEAIRKLTFHYPSRVFLAHFIILVFGEEMAKEGIEPVLMFFFRDTETKQRYNIAVVKGGTANDLLKIQTPVSKNPASEINQSIQAAQNTYGTAQIIYLNEVLSCLRTKENNPLLTGIEIDGSIKDGAENKNVEQSDLKTKIKLNGYGVFKGDKLVGWLNIDESQGYNHIMGKIVSTVQPVDFNDDDTLTFEIHGGKVKRNFKLIYNKPVIKIDYKVEGDFIGIESGKYQLTEKEIKEVEKNAAKEIKEKMEMSIEKSQKVYNSDIFKFGKLIHVKNPKYWNEIKDSYDEIYKEIKIEVKVDVKIVNSPA